MTIFGKYISLAVLTSFAVGLGTTALGLAQNIVNHWSGNNAAGYVTLIGGAVITLATTVIHTWDTMPANRPVPAGITGTQTPPAG